MPHPSEKLIRQFWLVVLTVHVWNQPAITNDVPGTLSLCHEESQGNDWISASDPVLNVRHGRVTIRVYLTMRRDASITLGPQLALESSIGHPPAPKPQPIRLKDDERRGHSIVVHSVKYV